MTRDAPPLHPPGFFDMATGGEMAPAVAAEAIVWAFASTLRHDTEWWIDSGAAALVGTEVSILSVAEEGGGLVVRLTAAGRQGVARLAPHASGWLALRVDMDGAASFHAWLDRPYEEYEFHPPGAAITTTPPGRISKRHAWVSLDCAAWPALAPLAGASGGLTILPADDD